jgi:ribonuclease-3
MRDLLKLEKALSVKFNNKQLLEQSVVHRSYLNENPDFPLDHNERLEFLGDAVLELVVTEYLYATYPNPEGELTNWRASLVNAKKLSEISKRLEIEDFLYLSKGEDKDKNSKARDYILANLFEAVVGAIYLDRGYKSASKFIHKCLIPELKPIIDQELYKDPKSKFQEVSQEKFGITPTYRVLEESGPDHARNFRIGVYLENELIGVGEGTSKKEAQEEAARRGLQAKGW